MDKVDEDQDYLEEEDEEEEFLDEEEDQEHQNHFSQQAKLVTFGALVHLNLEDNPSLYMYGDGFIDSRLKMKKFESEHNSHGNQGSANHQQSTMSNQKVPQQANNNNSDQEANNFTNCIFMILPFSSLSAFSHQKKILDEIKTTTNTKTLTSELQKLRDRKNKITQMKDKLFDELLDKKTNLKRSLGSKILLINSNFMLLHIDTMKYISLNMESQENLFIELVDEPTQYCFFKFIPSLQLQLMRNDNFVYEEELFYISSSETICGKRPFLIAEAKDQILDARGKIIENYVQGSIDNRKKWKLNLYQEPNLDPPEDESHSYLKCGDTLWMILSEKYSYLSSQRYCDPFVEVIRKKQIELSHQNTQITKEEQEDPDRKQAIQDIGHINDRLNEQLIKEYEKQLLQNFKPQFQTVQSSNGDNKMILLLDMSTNGLFRIEPQNQYIGGELEWRKPYKIRHVVSQKYLGIKVRQRQNNNTIAGAVGNKKKTIQISNQADFHFHLNKMNSQQGNGKHHHNKDIGYDVEFVHQKDLKDCFHLWSFIPIDNLMDKFQSKMKIHKDAYFRLENTETKFQLGFSEEQFEKNISKEFKDPVMHKFSKDVNTFRFRKASFQDMWETNFLISTMPVFLEIYRQIVYVDLDENEIKRDQKKFPNFDQKFPIVLQIIDNLIQFLNNQIIANMDLNSEYNQPCFKRQNKFREQFLLGLMAWTLVKIFPSQNEWKKIDLKPCDELVYLELYGTLYGLDQYGIKYTPKAKTKGETDQLNQQNKNKDKIMKTAQAHTKKKYALCYKIYQLLKIACYRNQDNQKYLERYIPYLTNHIGMGNFVSEAFQACFSSNFHILNCLHRTNFAQEEKDLGQEGNLFGNKDQKIDNFFKYLVKKLKQHDSYTKDDILNLLGTFCLFENSTIYINQEKIYSSFVENRTIIFTSLLKIHCERDYIYIEVRERENFEFKFNKYKLEDFQKQKPDMMIYLMAQLILYSSMCANRNYTCGKAFSEMFPQNVLKKYLNTTKVNNEIKAIVTRLLLNIYIDKEPRLIIQKPNLVRIFRRPKQFQKKNYLQKQLEKVKQTEAFQSGKNAMNKIGDAFEDMVYEDDGQSSSSASSDDEGGNEEDITVNFIKSNANGAEEDLKAIKQIIEKLTAQAFKAIEEEKKSASNRSNPQSPRHKTQSPRQKMYHEKEDNLIEEEDSVYDKIYNHLNYEIIKMFYTMLKFGMFTTYVGENSQDLLETIIQYLSFILEYDHAYFNEINCHLPPLKRRWIENSDNVKKKKDDAFADIGGNIANINIGILKKKKEEDKEDVVSEHRSNAQQEGSGFMKMYNSLFKLLEKYTNKTYTFKNEECNVQKNIEVKIKLEICKIFEYLMDWREEYQLDKIMKYFSEKFYGQFESKTEQEMQLNINNKDKELNESFLELLPQCMIGVGEEVYFPTKKRGLFFNVVDTYGIRPQIKNIDEILDRPFTEIMLIAFYFSNDADLQNSLMNLITRSYTQKQKLIKNLDKINLVAAGESDQSYQAISQLISRLKALHSYAQSWLQIIEQNNYNEKAEENLDVTLEQLKLLYQQFEHKPKNDEYLTEQEKNDILYIKQKIFKHLSGYNFLLTFLEQGASVLESNYKYFRKEQHECQFSYKKSFIHKIIEVFNMCHNVLQKFCLNNPKAQKTMFKNYQHLLENMNLVNMGQVNFIEQIFIGNQLLINKFDTIKYLKFMLNLIKHHGHHPQFLKLFQIFLQNAIPGSFNVQKQVLDLLLDPKNLSFLNPFRNEEEDDFTQELKHLPFFGEEEENSPLTKVKYAQLFVKIIADGLLCDIGVNYVVKAYQAVNIKQLLDLLVKKTIAFIKGEEDEDTNLFHRRTICTLFHIYLQKLEQATKEFWANSDYFLEIIELEFQLLSHYVNNRQFMDSNYSQYILQDFLPIINLYAEQFLKDIVMVSIMSLESKEEFEYANKLHEFSINLINNLDIYIDADEYSNISTDVAIQIENIRRMAKTFRIDLSPKYPAIQKCIQQFQLREYHDIDDFFETFVLPQQQMEQINPDKLFNALQDQKANIPLLNITQLSGQMSGISGPRSPSKTPSNMMLKSNSSYHSKGEKSYIGSDQPLKQSKKKMQSMHFQDVFQMFKTIFKTNKKVRKAVKDEGRRFVNSILDMEKYISNPKDARGDILLTKADIIKKLLQYLEKWKENKSSKLSAIFTLKVLRHIVVRGTPTAQQGEHIPQEQQQKELRQRQNMMDGLKTTHVILKLFWDNQQKDNHYQYYLLNLLISLLDTGNHHIQQSIYYFFLENNESEKFFAQLSDIIYEEVIIVKNSNGMETSIGKAGSGLKPVIERALQLLQLFCEGHYTDMQDYLREQTNSKVNYDMITLMVNMLVAFKISNQTQSAVQQCLDTLTEIVQGPCKLNQHKIADSKFLEFAVELLREEEKLFATTQVQELEEPQDQQLKSNKQNDKKKDEKQKKKGKNMNKVAPNSLNESHRKNGKNINIEMQQLNDEDEDGSHQSSVQQAKTNKYKIVNKINCHRGYIARIKYKCLITMLSLLEMSEDDIQIVNRIRRTIPLQVLTNNLADLFDIYKKKHDGKYPIEMFNRFDQPIDEEAPETKDDEFVIEIGFFLYTLIVILLETQPKSQMDSEQAENWELIKEYTTIEKQKQSDSLINKLFKLFKNFVVQAYTKARMMAEKANEALMSDEEKREMAKRKIEEEKRMRKQLKQDALEFFSRNTIHIEIARNEQISKVYFPMLPYCKLLQDETKDNFHENCDYSNSKTKLSSIMQQADKIIEIMEHEQKLQQYYSKSGLLFFLPFFANNKEIWEALAFYTNWVINLIILFSYSQKHYEEDPNLSEDQNEKILEDLRNEEPRLFFDNANTQTIDYIRGLGYANLILSGLVVSIFFLQKAPLLIKDLWTDWYESQYSKLIKFGLFWVVILKSIFACLTDFEFVYYSCYMTLVVLGLFVHPFIFGILTLDMLRSKTLKSVVKAIWLPKSTMALTFLLFLIITYWFTIFAYVYYQDNFEEQICDKLSICFLRVFDYMFKEGGGVGSFMAHPKLGDYEEGEGDDGYYVFKPIAIYETEPDGFQRVVEIEEVINYTYLGRFFYDFIVLFVLVILIMNMVAGIMIDTFKALQEDQQRIEEELNQFCFICNIEREKLDKAYDLSNGFFQHIKADHYLWNYIFFKAYILFKDKTEYTGNETYVVNSLKTLDVSWFPQKQAIAVQDEEEQDDKEKRELIHKFTHKMDDLNEQLTTLNQKAKNLIEYL